jgi:hypothetical protein
MLLSDYYYYYYYRKTYSSGFLYLLGRPTYDCWLQQPILLPVLPLQRDIALHQTLFLCSHFKYIHRQTLTAPHFWGDFVQPNFLSKLLSYINTTLQLGGGVRLSTTINE